MKINEILIENTQSDLFNKTRSFEHVASGRLKRILLSSSPSEKEIEWALTHTQEALWADQDNEHISTRVLADREEAYGDAESAFEEGDWEGALDAIREVWSV